MYPHVHLHAEGGLARVAFKLSGLRVGQVETYKMPTWCNTAAMMVLDMSPTQRVVQNVNSARECTRDCFVSTQQRRFLASHIPSKVANSTKSYRQYDIVRWSGTSGKLASFSGVGVLPRKNVYDFLPAACASSFTLLSCVCQSRMPTVPTRMPTISASCAR